MVEKDFKQEICNLKAVAIEKVKELQGIGFWRHLLWQGRLDALHTELVGLSVSLLELERKYDESLSISGSLNDLMFKNAENQMISILRHHTSTTITQAISSVDSLKNSLNFYRAVSISLIALGVSIAGIDG